ncbi:MAG: hypothetical protein AAF265_10520 [Pseudomonadota bacterium]
MSEPNFEKLDAAIADLARDIKPDRDLWPAIDRGIQPEKSFWQWRVAASVFATSLLIGMLLFPEGDMPPVVVENDAPFENLLPDADPEVLRYAGFDAEFVRVREQSMEQLADRLQDLSPATRGVILGNLRIIRESIAEINDAIEQEPDNVQLQQLLQIAYRQEMAIVSTVTESAKAVDRVRTTT